MRDSERTVCVRIIPPAFSATDVNSKGEKEITKEIGG